jgi:hypothetical protein
MSRRWWVLLGSLAIAAVVLGAVWANRESSGARPSGSPAAIGTSPTPTTTFASAVVSPSPSPNPSSSATRSAAPSATQAPPPPATTPPPRASGPPRLAYAAFLKRINDDRSTVETLNAALSSAARAQDPTAVRRSAVDILDFVDAERDWLRENPPAACYAEVHASAGAMLDAYAAAADAFIAWAQTGGGIAGLGALGQAVDAAETAGDALTTFGKVLEATSCPG